MLPTAVLHFMSLLVFVLTGDRLGRQSGPQESVQHVADFLEPTEFFQNYVTPGIPVLFKGVAKKFPAFNKWTDEYIKSADGSNSHYIMVEEGKKENRDEGSKVITLSEYIDIYTQEDVYCVSGLPKFLSKDIPIYKSVNCPFVLSNLMDDMILWFSSGGTKSVWHNDGYENINCLIRGNKELIMANKTEVDRAHIDQKDGSYSSVDVEDVDVGRYPGFKDILFYNVTMEAGDCLYIPWFWFHQVTSFGSNLAVNVWFQTYRSPIECEEKSTKAFDSVTFKQTTANVHRESALEDPPQTFHQLIYQHPSMYTETAINAEAFLEAVGEGFDEHNMEHVTDERIHDLFVILDKNQDNKLEYTEIDAIREILPKFLLTIKTEL